MLIGDKGQFQKESSHHQAMELKEDTVFGISYSMVLVIHRYLQSKANQWKILEISNSCVQPVLLPIMHLVAAQVIRLTVTVLQCLCSNNLHFN